MEFNFITKDSPLKPEGLVCVIDVIRAFTTTSYAFNKGVNKIILTSKIEDAFSLKKQNPDFLLMGEDEGIKIEGFDYGNSPFLIDKADLNGKTLIQRTSNGTKGAVNNLQAKKLITAAFTNANATFEYIKNSGIEDITFVITNDYKGSEDIALADYICNLLLENKNTDINTYLKLVESCRYADYIKEDMNYVLNQNIFDFVMEVNIENNLPILRKVKP